MKTSKPFDWSNPFQRYGFIRVNVLMGKYEAGDKDAFFGPLDKNTDPWVIDWPQTSLGKLLVHVGLFESVKEAERKGYIGRIPLGYNELWIKRWGREHCLYILNPLEESE